MAKKVRKATVLSTKQITPHLQRIVLGSEDFTDLTSDHIGSYVKVLIPKNGVADFNLKTACMRSYTIQNVIKAMVQLRSILLLICTKALQLTGQKPLK